MINEGVCNACESLWDKEDVNEKPELNRDLVVAYPDWENARYSLRYVKLESYNDIDFLFWTYLDDIIRPPSSFFRSLMFKSQSKLAKEYFKNKYLVQLNEYKKIFK